MDWKSARLVAVSALSAVLLHADDHGAPTPAPAEPTAAPPASHDAHAAPAADLKTVKMLHEAILTLLQEGNSRFAHGRTQHPHLENARRHTIAVEGQHPMATILTCSDSRAPVEYVFDRGLGDLFVVRVAGNVATDCELASIEYGVEHLTTPLLVVLGHTGCGAVTAVAQKSPMPGHLGVLAKEIQPAVDAARKSPGADLIATAVRVNVQLTLDGILDRCPAIKARVDQGLVSVLAAVYDLDSGIVEWLERPAVSMARHTATPAQPHRPAPETVAAGDHEPALDHADGHAPAAAKPTDHHVAPETPHPAPAAAHDPDDDEAIELARTPKRQAPPPPAPPAAATGHAEKATKPTPAKAAGEPLMFNAPITSSTPIGGLIRRPGEPAKKAH